MDVAAGVVPVGRCGRPCPAAKPKRRLGGALALSILLASAVSVRASERQENLLDPEFSNAARQVPIGASLRVEGVVLRSSSSGAGEARAAFAPAGQTLRMERFDVFAPTVEIVVHGGQRDELHARPETAYFRGQVEGDPESYAFLSIEQDGEVRGLVLSETGAHVVWSDEFNHPLVSPFEPDEGGVAPWACGGAVPPDTQALAAAMALAPESAASTTTVYNAPVAVETDYEFFTKFGSVEAQIAYIGDLFAAASAIFANDVRTTLEIEYLSLWTAGPSLDPWNATSGTGAVLSELRAYWLANRSHVHRAFTHMLSGKSLGGGIAYVGVLCSKNYGYGVSASLNGQFSMTQPWLYWDLFVVAHEIGHNFGTHHSHCYSPPVDECFGSEGGCFSGATSVPSNGGGSIMSYCHLRPGGYSNIQFSFGAAGLYGNASERIPAAMRGHVETVGALPTSCLDAGLSSEIYAATLPSSRSVEQGREASFYATILNAGSAAARDCGISPSTSIPGTFWFQTTEPQANLLVGAPNQVAEIPPGGTQTFAVFLNPTATFGPTEIELLFDCSNTAPAPIVTGLNTVRLSSSSSPVPDIIAFGATLTGDGYVRIPGVNGHTLFGVAISNLGAGETLTLSADTGGNSLPLLLRVCRTDAATGACLTTPSSSVSQWVGSGQDATFAVLVQGTGVVPFDPFKRIYARFRDQAGIERGSTTVSAFTQ